MKQHLFGESLKINHIRNEKIKRLRVYKFYDIYTQTKEHWRGINNWKICTWFSLTFYHIFAIVDISFETEISTDLKMQNESPEMCQRFKLTIIYNY